MRNELRFLLAMSITLFNWKLLVFALVPLVDICEVDSDDEEEVDDADECSDTELDLERTICANWSANAAMAAAALDKLFSSLFDATVPVFS